MICKWKIGARKCESAKLQYKSCSVRFDAVRCGSMRFRAVPCGFVRENGGRRSVRTSRSRDGRAAAPSNYETIRHVRHAQRRRGPRTRRIPQHNMSGGLGRHLCPHPTHMCLPPITQRTLAHVRGCGGDEPVSDQHALTQLIEQSTACRDLHPLRAAHMQRCAARVPPLQDIHDIGGERAEQRHEAVPLCHMWDSSAMGGMLTIPADPCAMGQLHCDAVLWEEHPPRARLTLACPWRANHRAYERHPSLSRCSAFPKSQDMSQQRGYALASP